MTNTKSTLSYVDERSTRDGNTEYLVKWTGYGDDANTWEPYDHVANTKALDEWEDRRGIRALGATLTNVIEEPSSYHEAVSCADAPHWRDAINAELDALDRNKTWEFVDRKSIPLDRQPIGCR
jgi:Chromo (CHRromatin Organisation MOdifier) domain